MVHIAYHFRRSAILTINIVLLNNYVLYPAPGELYNMIPSLEELLT